MIAPAAGASRDLQVDGHRAGAVALYDIGQQFVPVEVHGVGFDHVHVRPVGDHVAPQPPDGLGEPERQPLYPQRWVEIMGGRIALAEDDAVELLDDLPHPVVEEVLERLPDSEDLRERLEFEEDTAGEAMTTKFVAVIDHWNVRMATRAVRKMAAEIESFYEVYVVNEARQLVGRHQPGGARPDDPDGPPVVRRVRTFGRRPVRLRPSLEISNP